MKIINDLRETRHLRETLKNRAARGEGLKAKKKKKHVGSLEDVGKRAKWYQNSRSARKPKDGEILRFVPAGTICPDIPRDFYAKEGKGVSHRAKCQDLNWARSTDHYLVKIIGPQGGTTYYFPRVDMVEVY